MANYSANSGGVYVPDAFDDENRVDISEKIHRRWVDNFPLIAALTKSPVSNYRYEQRKSNITGQEYTSASSTVKGTSVAQTFSLTHNSSDLAGAAGALTSAFLAQHTLVLNMTNQNVYRLTSTTGVASGASGTWLNLTSTSTSKDSAAVFLKIGSAADEGTTIGTVVLPKMDRSYNLTMITRTPLLVTETMRASEQRYGSELERQRTEIAFDHMRKLELSAWWSDLKDGGSEGGGYRTTDGIMNLVCGGVLTTGNAEDIAGDLTEANFDSALKTGMVRTNRPDTNWAFFCSSTVYNAINNFAKDRMIINDSGRIDKYGTHVKGYMTPFGELTLIHEPWFNTVGANTTFDIGTGLGALLDMSQFEMVYLAGNGVNRNTSVLTNRQANDSDTYAEELLTEWGIRYTGWDGGYILYGITG